MEIPGQLPNESGQPAEGHAPRSSLVWIIAGTLWLALVSAVMVRLHAYHAEPGPAGEVLLSPATFQLPTTHDAPKLIVAVHPGCPCTRASIDELVRVLDMSDAHPRVEILVRHTQQGQPLANDHWLAEAFSRLNGLHTIEFVPDPAAARAESMGLLTSGSILLLDEQANIRFQGGVTGSRGHRGENPNANALLAALNNQLTDPVHAPVFGCPLASAQAEFSHAQN